MTTDAFDQTKTALLALGGQRAWSLMVSLFGDLAHSGTHSIDGPNLSAVMAQMDVRTQTVRVALHRLRNEGWITSQKQGRTRAHMLAPAGLQQTRAASVRIYGAPVLESGWTLILMPEVPEHEAALADAGFIRVLPRVYLGSDAARTPDDALSLKGDAVPDWLRAQLSQHILADEYRVLTGLLKRAEATLPAGSMTDLQITALRCLIVHNWRRLVLRHPAMPRAVLACDWPGYGCYRLVDTLLKRFPPPNRQDTAFVRHSAPV